MSTELEILSGDTYEVNSGDIEEYSRADIEGTLDVDGQLRLVDNPDRPVNEVDVNTSPIDIPIRPINVTDMETGTALFLGGWLALLMGAWVSLKNMAAGVTWSLALFALIASGLFQVGLETFWALSAATVLLIMVGVVVRWSE